MLTAILCFLNPYTRMGGTELIYNLFAECRKGSGDDLSGLCVLDPGSSEHVWPVVRAIFVAMVVKAGLTVITFGIKLPAGIFIPTLGVGACAGRLMGIAMQYLQARDPTSPLFRKCSGDLDCEFPAHHSIRWLLMILPLPLGIIPGLYAMVGAAGALSGVTVSCSLSSNHLHSRTLPEDHCLLGRHHVRADGYTDIRCPSYAFSTCCEDRGGCIGTKGYLRPCH